MGTVLTFIFGFICGGCIGMILTALIIAGDTDDD
jgi:hypothetical protein